MIQILQFCLSPKIKSMDSSNRLLLLLLLSHFSRVQLCATHRRQPTRLPSLGFSRQEHWSGLPFPSPMYESEKWKWSRSVESDSSRPHRLQSSRLLRPWDFPGKGTGVGCHCLLQEDNRGCEIMQSQQSLILIKTRFSFLQAFHIQMV